MVERPAAYYRYMEEFDASLERYLIQSELDDDEQNECRDYDAEIGEDDEDVYEDEEIQWEEREKWWEKVRKDSSRVFWNEVLKGKNDEAQVKAMRPLLGFLTVEYFEPYLVSESKLLDGVIPSHRILELVRLAPQLFSPMTNPEDGPIASRTRSKTRK